MCEFASFKILRYTGKTLKIGFLEPANMVHTVKWVNALTGQGHEVILYSLPTHKQSLNKIDPGVTVRYVKIRTVARSRGSNCVSCVIIFLRCVFLFFW